MAATRVETIGLKAIIRNRYFRKCFLQFEQKRENFLQIKGILLDELEIFHESFVEDTDRNWADATRFRSLLVAASILPYLIKR